MALVVNWDFDLLRFTLSFFLYSYLFLLFVSSTLCEYTLLKPYSELIRDTHFVLLLMLFLLLLLLLLFCAPVSQSRQQRLFM